MSKSFFIFLLMVLLAPSSPAGDFAPEANQSEIEAEEYSVYSFLIGNARFSIIKDRTVVNTLGFSSLDTDLDRIKSAVPTISQETLDDFSQKYSKARPLSRQFKVKGRYLLITDKELSRIFSCNDLKRSWRRFDKKYPLAHGFTSFSRVGFNAPKTEALVYTGYACGSLCGSGEYLFLVKERGKWKIMSRVPMWIS